MTEYEKPAYQKYIDLLKNKNPSIDSTGRDVLRLMREEIEPQIKRMTKPQLIEAFAEAIYAIHHHERWESVLDGTIEHYKDGSLTWEATAKILQEELEKAPSREISKRAKKAGSADKKKEKKAQALELWLKWGKDPQLFKSKSEFCAKLAYKKDTEPEFYAKFGCKEKNECYCSHNTAIRWFDKFREEHPQQSIEHLLPPKK